jgi:hypothetical protein
MLALIENNSKENFIDTTVLQKLYEEAFPRTGIEMMNFEKRVYAASINLGDSVTRAQIERAHTDPIFVAEAISAARRGSHVSLRHKGNRTTTIMLLGGTRIVVSTPYLRQQQRHRGPRRQKRYANGTGCYPVLAMLGIADRATAATRSEIALHVVQTASYSEAARMLERRGLSCDISTLVRVTTSVANKSLTLRDVALQAALELPISTNGPLCGKRVRVSLDGGRVRTRKNNRGRRTAKGRHTFTTPWREPRLLVIDILDEEGKPDRLSLPLYDATLGDADATWALLIGYLRLLGASHALIIEFIADGAPWIWDQIKELAKLAAIPPERIVEAIDFYHASEHLFKTIELCKGMPKAKRQHLYQQLRHALRHDKDGVEQILIQMRALAVTRRGKAINKALSYFETHQQRMRYHKLDEMKLPAGSGQVESAIRRVVNLRFKAPGTFWTEKCVGSLLHLRAAFKSGRWDEIFKGVLLGKFLIPNFEPSHNSVTTHSAEGIVLPQSTVSTSQWRKVS